MWPRMSYKVEFLTKLICIKNKFKWTNVEQDTFEKLGGSWPAIFINLSGF